MHALATVAIPSHPLALMLSSSSSSIDNVGFRLPLQPLLSRAQELIAVVVVVVVFLTHPPLPPRRYHPHLLPPSPSAPAPAPAPAPAADDPGFDPDHPFSFGDDWAINVLQDSFNELNDYLVCLGKSPVNQPLVQNVTEYVYAIFRVAEVIRGLP